MQMHNLPDRSSFMDKVLKGTTTVGVKFEEGVIIASDKRASVETFVASKRANKTIKISDHAVATISGMVADGQYLTNMLRMISDLHFYEEGKSLRIGSLARYLAILLRSYRPLMLAHLIVGGLDDMGFHLFNVDFLGTLTEEDYLATGSGSPIAISVVEEGYSPKMSIENAKLLVINAMLAALSRDSATGDGIDLTVVDSDGVHFLTAEEVNEVIKKLRGGNREF